MFLALVQYLGADACFSVQRIDWVAGACLCGVMLPTLPALSRPLLSHLRSLHVLRRTLHPAAVAAETHQLSTLMCVCAAPPTMLCRVSYTLQMHVCGTLGAAAAADTPNTSSTVLKLPPHSCYQIPPSCLQTLLPAGACLWRFGRPAAAAADTNCIQPNTVLCCPTLALPSAL